MKLIFNTLLQKTQESTASTIDIIDKVDNFYNSAWDKLIIVVSISIGIIGVLVPMIIQWYQRKIIKLSEENLRQELLNEMSNLKNELVKTIDEDIIEKIKVYEDKIEELTSLANGKVFHIQANGLMNSKNYKAALADYIIATENYFKGLDYSNLQNTLRLICDSCLPHLSKEEVNDIKISHNADLKELLDTLTEANDNGILTIQLRKIKLKLEKLPEKKTK